MKPLTKLNNLLDKLEDGQKPRNFKNISLYDIRILQDARDTLQNKRQYETINLNVKDICLCCGLNVKEKGIGWSITIENKK